MNLPWSWRSAFDWQRLFSWRARSRLRISSQMRACALLHERMRGKSLESFETLPNLKRSAQTHSSKKEKRARESVCVCVCVCERESGKKACETIERATKCVRERKCACVCVCVWEREREREKEKQPVHDVVAILFQSSNIFSRKKIEFPFGKEEREKLFSFHYDTPNFFLQIRMFLHLIKQQKTILTGQRF